MIKSLFNYSFRNKNFSTNSIKFPVNKDIKQVMPLDNNKNEAIINNNINYPFKTLTENQFKVLQMKLAQLDLHNKLLLTINKNIYNHPHQKVNDKMGNSINQSIIYNFSKYSSVRQGKTNNNISLIGPISTKNPSRLGIINFAVKIIKSVFDSLYCLISRPQFINKHDKLIVRILYYQNNINKNPLFSNNNANSILRSEAALPHLSKEITDSTHKESMKEKMLFSIFGNKFYSNQIAKNIRIKNFINSLNVLPSSPEVVAEKINCKDSLNNSIINKKINSSLIMPSIRKTGKIKINTHAYLLRKLIKTNNLDYLSTKRLNILRTTSNKLLMGRLIKILNNHNNKNVELIGTMTGKLLNPVNKNHLEKVIEGVYDPLTSLRVAGQGSKSILTSAMCSSVQDGENINQNLFSNKNLRSTDNILPKLINKINKNLINLKSQFIKNDKDVINFIYQNIIHQSSISLLNSSAAATNLKINRVHNLLLKLNRQLFLSRFLLNKNNSIISQDVSIKTLQYAIKILTLIINNNIKTNSIALISTNKKDSKYLGLTENSAQTLLLKKIKDIFLSHTFNKTKIQNTNILKNNIVKFKWLGVILSRIFGKNVEIQLVRLWNIGLESSITANIISKNSTNDKAQTILRKLWKKIVINKASSLSFLREKALLNSNDFVYNEFINNNSNACAAKNNLSLINNLSKEQLINIQNNSNKISIINNKGNLSPVLSKSLDIISKDKANLKTAQVNDFIKNLEIYNRTPLTLGKTVGISVRIAGRLAKERIKPRMTVTNIQVGSLSKSRVNYIEKFAFTNKNKKGAYTVTVKMGHSRS